MKTTHIRISGSTFERIDRLRQQLAADPDSASIGVELSRSAILRAAVERGLASLEGGTKASKTRANRKAA